MKIDSSNAILNAQKMPQINTNNDDKKLREQTNAFEALILKTLLKDAIKNEDPLYPKQPGSDIYHSMYIDSMSETLAGSFGYSDLLYNYLKENR